VYEHHTSRATRTSHNATYGLLATTKKWDHFPKDTKGRISPCTQAEGGGGGSGLLHGSPTYGSSVGPSYGKTLKVHESAKGQLMWSKAYCNATVTRIDLL